MRRLKTMRALSILSITLATLLCPAYSAPEKIAESDVRQKVGELLQRMTLDEKIGQLTQAGGLALVPNAPKPEDLVRKGQAGSVLWLSDPAAINRLQKIAVDETRLHIPLIFGLDVIHGFRTIYPMPLALAASWDLPLIERMTAMAAREARAAGITWTFAPMVDIARDPRWGRIMEGAGEDPFLGAAVASAQVRGFQGDDVSQPDRLLACAKHFAGYGAAVGGRDYDSSYLSDPELFNVYLPPFRAARDAGVATFMSAYMDLNDVPATANSFLLQDVLRKAWRFDGFVVSDAFAVRDLVTHGFARDAGDAALRAFNAGVNMDMASGTYPDHLSALVKSGKISETAIDDAVRPILAAKFRLGLFEHPYADEARAKAVVLTPEHRKAAREAAQRSAVLLRNEKELLPLSRTKSIAVIGPLADSQRDLLTMWSGFDVDPTKTVTIAQGIQNKLGRGSRVEYAPGVQIRKQFPSQFESFLGGKPVAPWSEAQAKAEFAKAVALAKRSDVVVLALGELQLMSGEAASYASLELPGRQLELMQAVAATGKPVVLVLVSGRPLAIGWASAHIPAIVEAWHPGMEGGNAIADLLFGDANFTGRLPLTWPRSAGQVPIYYAHNLTHQPETAEGFTSRYWDEATTPLYPFGYGLGYTGFTISNLRLQQDSVALGASVEGTVDVENTGKRDGEEVVQVYIHQKAGTASRPVREMKAFARVALAPGQKKTVRFSIGASDLRFWSAQRRDWVQDAGAFDLWVGRDSTAALHATFAVN
jgi:beta-glucosidase